MSLNGGIYHCVSTTDKTAIHDTLSAAEITEFEAKNITVTSESISKVAKEGTSLAIEEGIGCPVPSDHLTKAGGKIGILEAINVFDYSTPTVPVLPDNFETVTLAAPENG